MKYEVKFTSQFKKDYRLAQRRHLDMAKRRVFLPALHYVPY